MISLLFVGLALGAPSIDLTNASSSLGAHSGSWQHGPHNLWDGDPQTAWCTGTKGKQVGERIFFTVDGPLRADKIRIVPGDSVKFGGFSPANMPAKLSISNGKYVWQVIMPADPDPFELPIPPPITGRRLVVRFDAIHDRGGATTCLADLQLFQDGKPLASTARVDQGEGTIEGVWVLADKDHPEVFLTFMRDGRVRAQQEPLDDTPPPPVERGKWTRSESGKLVYDLAMEKETVRAHIRPGAGTGQPQLVLTGRFKGAWVPYVPGLYFGN